jgi:hypothetical protein
VFIHTHTHTHTHTYVRPVAAASKMWVCGRSPGEVVGSNPAGVMSVCLLWVLCVVRYRSLRRADHSLRGVISANVCDFETSRMRPQRHRKEQAYICIYIYIYTHTYTHKSKMFLHSTHIQITQAYHIIKYVAICAGPQNEEDWEQLAR